MLHALIALSKQIKRHNLWLFWARVSTQLLIYSQSQFANRWLEPYVIRRIPSDCNLFSDKKYETNKISHLSPDQHPAPTAKPTTWTSKNMNSDVSVAFALPGLIRNARASERHQPDTSAVTRRRHRRWAESKIFYKKSEGEKHHSMQEKHPNYSVCKQHVAVCK